MHITVNYRPRVHPLLKYGAVKRPLGLTYALTQSLLMLNFPLQDDPQCFDKLDCEKEAQSSFWPAQ